MTQPNFFIVGAPRCGTTALSEYLRCHPQIFMTEPKEPHYFAEDFPALRAVRSLDRYMKLFQKTTSEHIAVGEASVSYLYSAVAIENIFRFNKAAKIIVMLRNPVDMVYSLHVQLVYSLDEDEKDFQKAWRLQAERRSGRRIPKRCRRPAFLQYAAVGQLGSQVERVLKVFPQSQVKTVLFDDFVQDTQRAYEDILAFLKVESDGRIVFPRLNESKTGRIAWLDHLTYKPPAALFNLAEAVKRLSGREKLGAWDWIRRLNTRRAPRPPLSADFRAELAYEFWADIERLSRILGRDLSHWREQQNLVQSSERQ
jgi:hypothetical protein